MIHQIAPIPKTYPKPGKINKDLVEIRRIQSKIKQRQTEPVKPVSGLLWSPFTTGPFLVPITRWIE